MGFISRSKLYEMGLKSIGNNVLVSDKCSIYSPENIVIGNNVRVDDFCILSGNIIIGNNIHIGAYCGLYGKFGITMNDFSGLSPRCTIFSASDDFGGDYLISPMNPPIYTNVQGGRVILERLVQVGAGTVIMPNVVLLEGCAIGAMSYVKKDVMPYEIWAGNPLKFIKYRSKKIKELSYKVQNEL